MSVQRIHTPRVTNKKRLFSLKESGSYLGVSYWTARELIHSGTLPFIKIGTKILIDVNDLDNFIDSKKECFIY
jgi:excisionase family DNA binding protein